MGKAGKRAAKAAAKAGQPAPEGAAEEPAGGEPTEKEELSWRSGYLVFPVPRWGKAGAGRRAVALPLRPLLLLIFWFIWIHWR